MSISRRAMIIILFGVTFAGFLAWPQACVADELAQAIEQAVKLGKVDPGAPAGYLGIPGAPQVNLLLGFVWALWVGWIFSTVGAFGGIMAAVGHISIFGLGDYAKSLGKETSLNKIVTDSIRVSNQWLGGLSAALSTFNYWRMKRLVMPLGISLAIGSVGGSWLIPILTAGKVSFKSYQGYFGLFVLFLGCYLFYETTPAGMKRKQKAQAAAKAFQESVKQQRQGGAVDITEMGVRVQRFSPTLCEFTFFGVEFKFNPLIPVVGGFIIASMASFLGVGGGFLLVPFLTSVAGLPMYLVAGTSAMAVFIGMVNSIASYMFAKSTPVHWSLVGAELAGIAVGSIVGPRTSKYIPDVWLKRLFIVLAAYVGINYTSQGFFGYKLLP